jgi:hypothetical protein
LKNEHIKEIMAMEVKPDIIDIIEMKKYNGMATSKVCQRR